MKINDYKKILIDNNIHLFDHDIRISHYILNKFYKKEQVGGGKNIFNNKTSSEIKNIVDTALSPRYYNLFLVN
jgi:hypothetical protein